MANYASQVGTTSESAINSMLWSSFSQSSTVMNNSRIRRMLVNRDRTTTQFNETGTVLPPPFDQSGVAIRNMIGEMSQAVQVAASRITANPPDVSVIPLTTQSDINATVSKNAGMQERLDSELLYEAGLLDNQWESAWAKCITGAAFHLILPRDEDFGLPSRRYYDESDDEITALRRGGKLAPTPDTTKNGRTVWAQNAEEWINSRRDAMKNKAVGAIPGRSLFSWSVYPRDMVLKERDREAKDLKWAAIIEEIPVSECYPGSQFAMNLAAKRDEAYPELFGVFYDEKTKRCYGGINRGGPLSSNEQSFDAFTLIRWFDRKDQVILIAPRGSVQGATELWRGEHGCMVQGTPVCPVVEDAFMRTDISVTGKEYSTNLDRVFAYVPQINQLMTLMSNVATYNAIPRMVGELQAGATLRGDSGEPTAAGETAPVPGLAPDEIAFYPGKVTQLLINAETILEALKVYFDRFQMVMPTSGVDVSAGDAAAWALQIRIQTVQGEYTRPVANACQAITGIVQRMHGWLRQLDTPIYFFAAPGHRKSGRDIKGLIEFDPKDLTDSIRVTQDMNTPSEQTVRVQVGMEQWQAGLIDDEEYYDKYAREPDAREAVVRRWVQIVVNYVMTGALPPAPPGGQPGPDPIVKIVADGVRGAVNYQMIQQSDNYAIATAEQMVQQAQMQQAQMAGLAPNNVMPSGEGNVSAATGMRQPGMGMSPSLQGQLGSAAPGALNQSAPVMAR